MGPSDISTCMPWVTMHAPWSCLLLCPICPMGILHWAIGPRNTSTCIPWDTRHPPKSPFPVSHPCCGHIAMNHGTFSYALWATMYAPWSYLSPIPWTNCNGPWDLLTLQPISHGTLCIPHGPISCVPSIPWTYCNGPLDVLILQDLSHGPICHLAHGHIAMGHGTFGTLQFLSHGPICHLSQRHIMMDHGTFLHFNLCPMDI
jgi:hypothetical protein